jgi:ATP-dependent Lhr-like helicase
VDGALACYITRGEKQLVVFLPEHEPGRSRTAKAIAGALASIVSTGSRRAMLITDVNAEPASRSALGPYLAQAGFSASALGYQKRPA